MTVFTRESREQWGAAPPRARRYDVSPRGVAIHYPGPGRFVFDDHRHCQSLMRRWQEMHMARGSNDLEYGAVMCHHLILMEARTEFDRPTVRVGSNGTAAANYTHTSVQLMRGTLDPGPTDREIQALGEYVAWLRKAGGWGPEVTGHRDHYATACPGDALYARLGDIDRIADATDTTKKDWFDMATKKDLESVVRSVVGDAVWGHRIDVPDFAGIWKADDGKRAANMVLAGIANRASTAARLSREGVSATENVQTFFADFLEERLAEVLTEADLAKVRAVFEDALADPGDGELGPKA